MTNIQMLSNEGVCRAMGLEKDPIVGRGAVGKFIWRNKDDSIIIQNTPDFDNDMNAWFKWVVPWLKEKYGITKIIFDGEMVTFFKPVSWEFEHMSSGHDKSPAIAFKKAFTELVKGE